MASRSSIEEILDNPEPFQGKCQKVVKEDGLVNLCGEDGTVYITLSESAYDDALKWKPEGMSLFDWYKQWIILDRTFDEKLT